MTNRFVVALLATISFSSMAHAFFTVSPQKTRIINASAVSCISYRQAVESGTTPFADIPSSYIRISNAQFDFADSKKSLNVQGIDVRITTPNEVVRYTLAGDAMFALNSIWWKNGEAVIGGPVRKSYKNPNQTYQPDQTIKADCALIVGQIPTSQKSFEATVEMTAYGYTETESGEQDFAESKQTFKAIYQYN